MGCIKRCYLCNKRFSRTKILKHDEHIIPNSVGGRLIIRDILCEDCGGLLGESTDAPFAKQLEVITSLLQSKRDRGEYNRSNVDVHLADEFSPSIADVKYQLNSDFSIIPCRPVLLINEKNKKALIAGPTKKIRNNYAKSPETNKYRERGFNIGIINDIAQYVQSANLSLSPHSNPILREVLKVAIGFARYHGVPRKYISHLIHDRRLAPDIDMHDFIWQHFPTTEEEKLYEINKHTSEDHYPNHQLYLFNIESCLYCYVELCGVIQKYVLLSEAYSGPEIIEKYLQKLTAWDFCPDDWVAKSCSDFDILLKEFNITPAGRNVDELQEAIINSARNRCYKISAESQLEKVKTIYEYATSWHFMKLEGHEIFDEMTQRMAHAEELCGSTLRQSIDSNPFQIMDHIDRDHSRFRIGNLTHNCAQKSKETRAELKHKYVQYKAFEISSHLGLRDHLKLEISPELP